MNILNSYLGVKPKLALIAGKGKLPEELLRSAKERGEEILTIGVERITDIKTDYVVPITGLGKLLRILEKERVKGIFLLGKFEHRLIYSDILRFDLTTLSFLRSLPDKRPQTLVRAFINLLKEKGYDFPDPRPYLSHILAGRGLLNRVEPSSDVLEDGLWGFRVAKEVAELDVGQTLVVKDKAVVAVEAMEGTQETITRAGKLCGDFVVVKVARKSQDFRIDVPTVGPETLEVMRRSKAKALFLEAGKVYIVEKERFLSLADRYKISVWGV
ncbi:MAG: LpxI family protein [Aquificae bacterium]|nr:LpxI family protein [Aquificota bacterium]